MQDMTISEAARKAGVGVEMIRFYEREGPIEQPRKPAAVGFQSYPEDTIERIRFIRQAQELSFLATRGRGTAGAAGRPQGRCRRRAVHGRRRCSIVEALNSSVPPRGMGKTRGEK